MQFKKMGRRVQVLAYRGYDKDKRRAIIKMMGSYDVHSYEPSDGLIESLTDDEKKELQSHIEKERHEAEKWRRQYSAKNAYSQINDVAGVISSGDFVPSEEWIAKTWDAIGALSKAMRRAGYRRPGKAKVPDVMQGQVGLLPLEDAAETSSAS